MKDVDGQDFFRVLESVARRIKEVRRTGSSLTVTIPHPIVKHLGLREGDRIFFYPIGEREAGIRRDVGNVREFILEEIERMQKARELMSRLGEELGKGNVSIIDELRSIRNEIREVSSMLRKVSAGRMLHFSDEDSYLTAIALEIESEREDEFQGILEGIKRLRERRDLLRRAVENLMDWMEEGSIDREEGKTLLERMRGELQLADQRLALIEKLLR